MSHGNYIVSDGAMSSFGTVIYAIIALSMPTWWAIYAIGGWSLVAIIAYIGVTLLSIIAWWMHRYPDVRRR